MRNSLFGAVIALALGLPPAGAAATSFSVIGTIDGGPMIGGYHFGKLYGIVPYGGAGSGSLFTLGTGGTYTLLHNFVAAVDGSAPNGQIDVDSAGNVFGTAANAGPNGAGTLWKYSPTAGMTTLHAFGASGDGDTPLEGPVRDSAGALFGTTAGGDVNTNGGLWGISSTGTYSNLYDFLSGADGHCPFSGSARAPGGTLYGTTIGNGYGGNPTGSVWKFSPDRKLTTIHVFHDTTDGEWPTIAPVLDKSGNLYGTTYMQHGVNFAGAIWKITSSGKFTVLHDLVAGRDGSGPNGPLLLDIDGNLYGTAQDSGPNGWGTVFRITPSGTFSVVHAFANGTDGAGPTGTLAQDGTGALYGGTATGQVFKIVP
jgi:uncharacterized repeat protein (TIGR03803 family)